jgi:hypothetical protein
MRFTDSDQSARQLLQVLPQHGGLSLESAVFKESWRLCLCGG